MAVVFLSIVSCLCHLRSQTIGVVSIRPWAEKGPSNYTIKQKCARCVQMMAIRLIESFNLAVPSQLVSEPKRTGGGTSMTNFEVFTT